MQNPGSLRAAIACAACAAAVALGCGSGEEAPATPAAPPAEAPAPATAAPRTQPPAPAAAPAAAAAEEAGGAQPAAGADPARGAVLYQQYCAACHGATGKGDGPAGMALDPRPASHADGNYMNPLSNAHLFKVIKEGGASVGKSPLMAPWGGSLSDAQIWDVVAYVRTLADPPYPGPMP